MNNLCLQTIRLEQPWGTCGAQSLQFYKPDEVYSSSKCNMECKTRSLKQQCSCKLPYMPGNDNVWLNNCIWVLVASVCVSVAETVAIYLTVTSDMRKICCAMHLFTSRLKYTEEFWLAWFVSKNVEVVYWSRFIFTRTRWSVEG
jgi:Amiloride-sensitive sodium channel